MLLKRRSIVTGILKSDLLSILKGKRRRRNVNIDKQIDQLTKNLANRDERVRTLEDATNHAMEGLIRGVSDWSKFVDGVALPSVDFVNNHTAYSSIPALQRHIRQMVSVEKRVRNAHGNIFSKFEPRMHTLCRSSHALARNGDLCYQAKRGPLCRLLDTGAS